MTMQQTLRRAIPLALSAAVLAAVGCSTTTAPAPAPETFSSISVVPVTKVAAEPVAAPFMIDYGSAPIHRQSLEQAGLLSAFETYWNVHTSKDWQRLFTMEHGTNLPSAEFYTGYHAKAWPVLAIQVTDVELKDQQATLTLHMRFQNPEKKGREHTLYRKDQWVRTEASRWVHVVTDPMLVGMRY